MAKKSRMGRLGLGVLTAALVFASTPVQAGGAPVSATPAISPSLASHLPSAGVRSFETPEVPASVFDQPHDLIASSGNRNDPLTYARAEHRLLERTWGPLRSLNEAAEGSSEASTVPDGRIRVPITSSDFDGDEREDVIYFDIEIDENTFRTGVRLTALDGTTGRLLWSKDYGNPLDLLVFSPGDVTGDGAEDLLVVVMEQSWQPKDIACLRPVVCTYDDVVTYAWTVELLSGPDATTTWDQKVDGSIRYTGGYAGQGPGLTVARHTEAINALIDIRPSADIDGDDLDDFTVNLLGYSGELVFSQFVSKEDFTFTTTATAVAGGTGQTLYSRSAEDQRGTALLTPAGDTTGDGHADLLWTVPTELETPRVCAGTAGCAQVRSLQLHVEAIDSATQDVAWEADVDDFGVIAGAPVLTQRDLTGDSSADVVLGLTFDDGTQSAVTLSGTDGTQEWSFDTLLTDPPSAIGSVDQGPGSDVLFWEGWYPTEEEAPGVVFRIRLRRVDGSTGQELFTTQHDLLEQGDKLPTIFAYPAGDGDGDGIADIALATWHYDGWWVPEGAAATVLAVESGKNGSEIVRLQRDRKALLLPGGDWVAGGPLDMFEGSTPYNDVDFRLSAIEMPTGDTLWSRQDIAFTALFGPLSNHAGGGDDLVYGRTQTIDEPPRRRSRIDVLRGLTGTGLWGVGPTMDNAPT